MPKTNEHSLFLSPTSIDKIYREIFNAQLKYSADTIRFICEYNKNDYIMIF